MRRIRQEFEVSYQYDVLFTRDLFELSNSLLVDLIRNRPSNLPTKVLMCLDDGVVNHHPSLIEQIKAYVEQYKDVFMLAGEPLILPGGEPVKNDQKYVHQVLDAIHEYGVDRHSYVVGLGGGAILDMVGFAATIGHRGIRHIRIPTTVLSQNDSGVGVKNSVNAYGKKNFLGCFAPPVAVINDLNFLRTLEQRDWRSGISEAIKVALIKDASFYEWIEANAVALNQRDEGAMEELIFECARLHVEHIGGGGDPFEQGSSRPLDFGHWAAHKLEYLTNYALRHGEAVAIGIALDVIYSERIGMLDVESRDRVLKLIRTLEFDLFAPELLHKTDGELTLLRGLNEFREHLGGQLTIMQLEAIGIGKNVNEMDHEKVTESIYLLEEIHKSAVV